jgi:hypothetical protein
MLYLERKSRSSKMNRRPACFLLAFFLGAIILPASLHADDSTPREQNQTSPRDAIHRKLKKKIDWNFKIAPLSEVAAVIQEDLNFPIQLDVRAMEEIGVTRDNPVTFSISGVSAKTGLKLLLHQLLLTTYIEDEVLMISTAEEADAHLYAVVYDVTDLVYFETATPASFSGWMSEQSTVPVQLGRNAPHCEPKTDFESLIDLITKTIRPSSWDEVGGNGSIQSFEAIHAIVVSQTGDIHEEVKDLLDQLHSLRHPGKGSGKSAESPRLNVPLELPAEKKTSGEQDSKEAERTKFRAALAKRVSPDFTEASLDDIAEYLRKESGLRVVVDAKEIESEKLGKISARLKDVELKTAMNSMLRSNKLGWTVADGVFWITTEGRIEEMLETRVYDVSDLRPADQNDEKAPFDYNQLIDMITATIRPTSWDAVGGPCNIEPFSQGKVHSISILQNWRTHEQIRELLAELRKLKSQAITGKDLEKLRLKYADP